LPFVEIGKEVDWVRISARHNILVICKNLRGKFEKEKIRLYHDSKNNLFGIEPSSMLGYKIGEYGRIRCRRLPVEGKFEAFWDSDRNMIIADLTKPL